MAQTRRGRHKAPSGLARLRREDVAPEAVIRHTANRSGRASAARHVIDPRSGTPGPNPNFIADVKKLAAPEAHLYVSCQAGGRSIGACRDLAAAGFLNLINVDGGFGGRPGTPGWRDSGLPVER